MLTKKTILLSSTDPWSDVYLSKHNYAIELVKGGNTLYFLNPPVSKKLRPGQVTLKKTSFPNLFEINHRLYFPIFIKFRLPRIFNQLMKLQVYLILKKINRKLDIVWDFNVNLLFSDLRLFKAEVKIFHPVDRITKKIDNRNADITFSVSNRILDMVESTNKPKVFLNHGLGSHFVNAAKEKKTFTVNNPIKACYVGNLLIHCLDHHILRTTIEHHPQIEFHFVGPNEKKDSPFVDSSSESSFQFITFLKTQTNVILHGTVKSSDIIDTLKDFDIFLLCYTDSDSFANDNSHKILEYLSTGRVIVSSYISEYVDKDFIVMCKEDRPEGFSVLFSDVVKNIEEFNNLNQSKKRISYALDNTYEKQLNRIEEALYHYSILKNNKKTDDKHRNKNLEGSEKFTLQKN